MQDQLQQAERLGAISKEIGFALWQLQTLEGAAAQFYVMVGLASPGMGMEAGVALLKDAQGKTFGSTVNKLTKGDKLPEELASRFQKLLRERNWLVHSSRETSRNAVYHDDLCARLIERVDAIGEEAHQLLIEVNKVAIAFVAKHGIKIDHVAKLAARTLNEWHAAD